VRGKTVKTTHSDRRIIDELEQARAVRNMRPEPLDMVSENRCSEHQDQIVAPKARNDLLAVRGEEPGE